MEPDGYSPVNATQEQLRAMDQRALQDERYQNGDCVSCGYPLDDYSIGHGYSYCGECKPTSKGQ